MVSIHDQLRQILKYFFHIAFLLPAMLLGQEKAYRVQFTDKNNSPYSITEPSDYLSLRAIERREKFNIPITQQDLPVNPQYIQTVISGATVRLHHQSKWLNYITVFTEDSLYMLQVASLPFVSVVEITKPDDGRSASENKFEEVEQCDCIGLLNETAGEAYGQNKMIGVHNMHIKGFTGKGLRIAVLDSGFDLVNQNEFFTRLFENNQILGTHDFVDGDTDVYGHHFHGTAVLSTIAAYKENVYVGTAPDAEFYLLRTEDVSSEYLIEEDNWVAAAEYADSAGADIINTSLGYSRFDDSTQNHTYTDLDGETTRIAIASNIAASKGILLLTSAGNYGTTPWYYISTPADAKNILTVGAVGSDREYAAFSSHGPSADGRIKPDIAAQGFQAKLVFPYVEEIVAGSGTSFSSPIMAGAMACLWQALPDKSNIELIYLARKYAHLYPGYNYELGFGIPNVYDAYMAESGEVAGKTFRLFPNPVEKICYLETLGYSEEGKREVAVSIFDLSGREVNQCLYTFSGNEIFRISDQITCLSSGIYLVKLEEGKTTQWTRMMKE